MEFIHKDVILGAFFINPTFSHIKKVKHDINEKVGSMGERVGAWGRCLIIHQFVNNLYNYHLFHKISNTLVKMFYSSKKGNLLAVDVTCFFLILLSYL